MESNQQLPSLRLEWNILLTIHGQDFSLASVNLYCFGENFMGAVGLPHHFCCCLMNSLYHFWKLPRLFFLMHIGFLGGKYAAAVDLSCLFLGLSCLECRFVSQCVCGFAASSLFSNEVVDKGDIFAEETLTTENYNKIYWNSTPPSSCFTTH